MGEQSSFVSRGCESSVHLPQTALEALFGPEVGFVHWTTATIAHLCSLRFLRLIQH